jgi:hypothetical protein
MSALQLFVDELPRLSCYTTKTARVNDSLLILELPMGEHIAISVGEMLQIMCEGSEQSKKPPSEPVRGLRHSCALKGCPSEFAEALHDSSRTTPTNHAAVDNAINAGTSMRSCLHRKRRKQSQDRLAFAATIDS